MPWPAAAPSPPGSRRCRMVMPWMWSGAWRRGVVMPGAFRAAAHRRRHHPQVPGRDSIRSLRGQAGGGADRRATGGPCGCCSAIAMRPGWSWARCAAAAWARRRRHRPRDLAAVCPRRVRIPASADQAGSSAGRPAPPCAAAGGAHRGGPGAAHPPAGAQPGAPPVGCEHDRTRPTVRPPGPTGSSPPGQALDEAASGLGVDLRGVWVRARIDTRLAVVLERPRPGRPHRTWPRPACRLPPPPGLRPAPSRAELVGRVMRIPGDN